jgi:hypothetical protein
MQFKRIPLFIQHKQVTPMPPAVFIQPSLSKTVPRFQQIRSKQVSDRLSMKGLFIKNASCKACSRK